MKKLSHIFLIIFLSGCMIHKEKLTFYNNTYIPNSSCLKTNGFYINIKNNWFGNKDIAPVFFYKDGSFHTGCTYDSTFSIPQIEEDAANYQKYHGDLWGFYLCKNDTLITESIVTDPYSWKASLVTINGFCRNSDTIYFENDFNNPWVFIESKYKPDSTNNWVKTHRKYRINQ